MALTLRSIAAAGAVLTLAACTGPLKLAKDDSAQVLAHQSITAPNPADKGSFTVKYLTYGSGDDKQRPEYNKGVAIKTKTVTCRRSPRSPRRRRNIAKTSLDSI
jgi:hypothetical protein